MNNNLMMDLDPLSSYEAQYDYPIPTPNFYPQPEPLPFYKNVETYPQPYQLQPLPPPVVNQPPELPEPVNEPEPTEPPVEDVDIKPDIEELKAQVAKKTRSTKKPKGKTSNYWNKKIDDKDFEFYGCSVCDISFKNIIELDTHVIIHSNRMTSYDLRLQNMKKRKLLKKAKKKIKKGLKVKQESQDNGKELEIKPEDGYIGTEQASKLTTEDNKAAVSATPQENNENNPANKNVNNHVNVYKCFGCNKQFALSYYLRIHVRSHTDEKPYTCSVCGQSFITASKLGRHNKRTHLAIRHQCRICYKIFNRFELLVKHFDKKHAEDKLDGEPYDYNAILPYLVELEKELELKKEMEKKPKTEDLWDNDNGAESLCQVTMAAELVAKEENYVSNETDKVQLPLNIEFFDESKEILNPLVVEIKQESEEKIENALCDENDDHFDNHCDQGNHDNSDDEDEKKVKDEKEAVSDEEYFPRDTWARPPAPPTASPPPPAGPTCPVCNKKLSTKSYLRVHMRTHTGEKPFKCYICARAFITANKMHRHVLTHKESWKDKDSAEVKVEPSAETVAAGEPGEDIKTHIKCEPDMDEDDKPLQMIKQSKQVKKKALPTKALKEKKAFFKKKEKLTAKKWNLSCEFCHQKFLHTETLEIHKRCHSAEQSIACHYCLTQFQDKQELLEHEATHTGPKPFMCTECGHSYKKRGAMIQHRKARCKAAENRDKTFVCEICSKRYSTQNKLQRHMISHAVGRFTYRYECPVCAHMFHTRYHVQMHLRSHMKEGVILEENRAAVLAMALQNARKIPKSSNVDAAVIEPDQQDERSRICNICGQIFQHFFFLEEHLRTHATDIAAQDEEKEDERKHTCPVCSKSFKLHYYLKLHSYTHTKEKPFICQQCGKGFITKGKLKRHIETHQGVKKYQCHVCYKFFTRPSYLRIHVRTIHGTQDYNFRDYTMGVPIGATIN